MEKIKTILILWDSHTKTLEGIYNDLIDGKSELATILLQDTIRLHNNQSRDFLVKVLGEMK